MCTPWIEKSRVTAELDLGVVFAWYCLLRRMMKSLVGHSFAVECMLHLSRIPLLALMHSIVVVVVVVSGCF